MRRSAEPAAGRIWRSAWVLPVADGPLRAGAVAARAGMVVQVGPADRVVADNPDLPIEDLGDAIIVPGFVDAHCHLEWSLLDGLLPPGAFSEWLGRLLPLRMRLSRADHAAAARLGALQALEAGTTTLADSGPTGAGAAALAESGLRGLVHLEAFGRETGAAAAGVAARMAESVAILDAAVGPRGRVGVSPHAPYTVGPELWRAMRAHPALATRPWATHFAESLDEERVIADGGGPLGALFAAADLEPGRWPGPTEAGVITRAGAAGALEPGLVAAHCVHVSGDEPAALAHAGVGVAHCPRSNAHLRCGRAPLEALLRAGVVVGLGTDSPASGGDYDLRAEARACRAAHAGVIAIDDERALRLITIDAARAIGMERQVGTLQPGRRADLVALQPIVTDDDPLAAVLDPGTRVRAVVVGGETLMEDGLPTRVDAREIRTLADEVRGRLC